MNVLSDATKTRKRGAAQVRTLVRQRIYLSRVQNLTCYSAFLFCQRKHFIAKDSRKACVNSHNYNVFLDCECAIIAGERIHFKIRSNFGTPPPRWIANWLYTSTIFILGSY